MPINPMNTQEFSTITRNAHELLHRFQKDNGLTDLQLCRILATVQKSILYWATRREQRELRESESRGQEDGGRGPTS